MVSFEAGGGLTALTDSAPIRMRSAHPLHHDLRFADIAVRERPMLPGGFEPMTAVYTSEDGTVYDSTDGWRIENYGSDKILAREVGGTLDAEIAEGKGRTDILITSRDAIARLVRRGPNTRPPAVRRRPKRIGADDNLGCQERANYVDEVPAVIEERGHRSHPRLPTHGPSGGVANSLDEAKSVFRAAWEALV